MFVKDNHRLVNIVMTVSVCRFLFGFQLSLVLFHSEKRKYLLTICRSFSLCILLRKTSCRISREIVFSEILLLLSSKIMFLKVAIPSRIKYEGMFNNNHRGVKIPVHASAICFADK